MGKKKRSSGFKTRKSTRLDAKKAIDAFEDENYSSDSFFQPSNENFENLNAFQKQGKTVPPCSPSKFSSLGDKQRDENLISRATSPSFSKSSTHTNPNALGILKENSSTNSSLEL